MMARHGADYLIFSTMDEEIAEAIIKEAELGPAFDGMKEFPPDSLIRLSLSGQFESGAGLEVVHRSEPDGDVVILRLAPGGQG